MTHFTHRCAVMPETQTCSTRIWLLSSCFCLQSLEIWIFSKLSLYTTTFKPAPFKWMRIWMHRAHVCSKWVCFIYYLWCKLSWFAPKITHTTLPLLCHKGLPCHGCQIWGCEIPSIRLGLAAGYLAAMTVLRLLSDCPRICKLLVMGGLSKHTSDAINCLTYSMLEKESSVEVIILFFLSVHEDGHWGTKRRTCWRRLMAGGVTLPGHMSVISGSVATEERGTTGAPCQRLAAAQSRDGWESEGRNRAVSHPHRQVALQGGLRFNMSGEYSCVFVF